MGTLPSAEPRRPSELPHPRLWRCEPQLTRRARSEFVFDNSWASAYARNGARYYPKLQCCVPFTPVTGPRLLVRPEAPEGLANTMAQGLVAVADAMDVSSVHVTFPTRAEADLMVQDGWMMRTGLQYHWTNRGYSSFADFEAALTQKRRKVVRQERKKAQEGLVIRRLRGNDIKQHHWDAFYDFYCDTADKKWGTACASCHPGAACCRIRH